MTDRLHIRNAEAAHLARKLARKTGRTISEVVLEALRQYRPRRRARKSAKQVERWQKLLSEDQKRLAPDPQIPVEVLYDSKTGLPG